jgi:hypothetical protein
VFQNCQSGEQSYIHVGCSAHCLSVSCNYEYDKSIVSCIHLDRCFQFKYHSSKVCSFQLRCFDNYVMFPVMNFWGVFFFEFIQLFYVLRISSSLGFQVLFFLVYPLSKIKLNYGNEFILKESFSSVLTYISIGLASWS